MPTLTLTLPRLHDGQRQLKQERQRYNVASWGRRSGKTTLGKDLCIEPDVLAYPVAWYAPSYKDMLEVWREMRQLLQPITKRANATERRIENIAGGVLEFWSADNVNAGRGRKYKRIIFDECAFVPHLMDLWNFTARPTLVDFAGDAYFFSTPKGRNGFWQLWQLGQDDGMGDWASWQFPTSINPIIPQSEIDAMRATLPERVYAQEINAAFLDDAGGVFRNVMACATSVAEYEPRGDRTYIIGADWGKHNDFTVFTVLDAQARRMVAMDRFNQIDYTLQVGRLEALAQRYRATAIIAERNSMGEPLVEQLQRAGLPVMPFTTTNATKTQIIDALALAFERNEIEIFNDPTLVGELQSYEMERLPSGMMRYSAPEGMHDDTVISLALAWHGTQMGRGTRLRMREY